MTMVDTRIDYREGGYNRSGRDYSDVNYDGDKDCGYSHGGSCFSRAGDNGDGSWRN